MRTRLGRASSSTREQRDHRPAGRLEVDRRQGCAQGSKADRRPGEVLAEPADLDDRARICADQGQGHAGVRRARRDRLHPGDSAGRGRRRQLGHEHRGLGAVLDACDRGHEEDDGRSRTSSSSSRPTARATPNSPASPATGSSRSGSTSSTTDGRRRRSGGAGRQPRLDQLLSERACSRMLTDS